MEEVHSQKACLSISWPLRSRSQQEREREGVMEMGGFYFDSPHVLEKGASVMFVFQGETSAALLRTTHRGLGLRPALMYKNE